jgi:pimeloyl-ACP methyl ester carboxylesterase
VTLKTYESGAGAQPLVMVHGWTCDHTSMAPLVRAFERSRTCLSVDLLGHGASPKSETYAIETQAKALLDVVPDKSILVGHSMGAQVAIEAACQAPDKIAAIVLLDPAQIIPIEKSRLFGEGMRTHLDQKDPREVLAAFADSQAVRVADTAESQASIAQMLKTDPDVIHKAWHAIMDWQGADKIARVACPALVIAIDKPINRLVDLARANKKLMTGQVVGSGHSLQFEVMDQVKPMMERFFTLHGFA